MTYQIRGPHIIGAILTSALASLPLDWQVVEAVRMDVRMERAARAAAEREARRERDRALADSTCVLSPGCVHADGPERRGNQGVTLGRDRGFYTVTSYSHGCVKPNGAPDAPWCIGRPKSPAASGSWPVPNMHAAADWSIHPPGSVLIVGGQRWRVTDRGHDIRGRRLDLFLSTCAEARLYGRRFMSVREVGR